MVFQPVPLTAVAELLIGTSGSTNWGPAQNSYHFYNPGGYDASDLLALGQGVRDWWIGEMAELLSADIALQSVYVRGLESDPDVAALVVGSLPSPGTVASNVLPASVAACIRFTTGQVGRSTRGRTFIAGLPVSKVNDDDIDSGTRTALLTAFNSGLAGYLPTGWTFVLVSRFHDGDMRDEGITYPITAASFSSNQVATQQRRLHRYD